MNKDLQAEIDNWRADYLHLGHELGEVINEQQDFKKWKQELREEMRAEIDDEYLTEKMVRKMSIDDMILS